MLLHHAIMAEGASQGLSGRYWRLLPTAISWKDPYGGYPYFQAVYEFNLVNGSGNSVSVGKTAYALTTLSAYAASKACDGSTATYWQVESGSVPQWWYVDCGSPVVVKSMVLVCFAAGYHAKSYKVQLSADAVSWKDICAITTTSADTTQTFVIQ